VAYKLGALPAVRPAALADLDTYAAGRLPTPPATYEVPKASYPIDGNDRYGDCTIAAVAHAIEGWNMEVHQHDPVPPEQDVVETYFKLTGGEDAGLVVADVLATWHARGLFGRKIRAYAPVNPRNLLQLHQSVAFYGGCYLGIECPQSAQEQFMAGEMWTYVEGSPVEGGHAVHALGYGPHGGLHCATWGGIAILSAGFLAHYLTEAWCILSNQIVEAKKDALGIDLASLEADLQKV
jgi:hypothetical protein